MGTRGRVVATFHHRAEPDLDQAVLAILDAIDHMALAATDPATGPAPDDPGSAVERRAS